MIDSEEPTDATDRSVARAMLALDLLRDRYRARYGEPVFDVRPEALPHGGLRVIGRVLLPTQRQAAVAAVEAAAGAAVSNEIALITDGDDAVGWGAPVDAVVDVLAAPAGDRATQVARGDPPVRCLWRRGAWWLIELADGTVGWVGSGALSELPAAELPPDVRSWRRSWAGHPRRATGADWRDGAAAWFGVPYFLGGTTPAGVDCSGLMQRLYRAVLGVGLPKHSMDQVRRGRRVARAEVEVGDLLGLTHTRNGFWHVAVVLGGDPPTVAHACRDRAEVAEEPLEGLWRRYRFRAARRFSPEPESGP